MLNKAMILTIIASLGCSSGAGDMPSGAKYVNSIGMKFVRIEPGTFMMGFEGELLSDKLTITHKEGNPRNALRRGNYDEKPRHKVTITRPFYIGVYEVTNAQYEMYDPKHRLYRGKAGVSKESDEPVIMVSWNDAVRFCRWLSKKEGLNYRLPTEAEWEYACRAGTQTPFHTGETLPEGEIPASKWGLYNMHSGVGEWCYDWYGPYPDSHQTDPIGREDGDYKVIRGGSDTDAAFYRRSANRSGTIAVDKSRLIGIRVVLGPEPIGKGLPVVKQLYQRCVSEKIPADLEKGPDPHKPYFKIRRYINIQEGKKGPLYYYHNHNPDITQCPNGDLLAIHFSTRSEGDREMIYGGSRLRYGKDKWGKSSLFWFPPDRKAEYSVLWTDKDTVYNFSSLGVSNSRPAAIVMRTSKDSGASWSKPCIIVERDHDHGVMESVFRHSCGTVIIPADDHNLFISLDDGLTWFSPCGGDNGPAGIHTPMTELKKGNLMSFGRYGDINGKMPKSISFNLGRTWVHSASEFTPIGGGQRATMIRLKEGPIFFASFAENMRMTDGTGTEQSVCDGLFGALSFDEGETWPVKRLISDGSGRKVFTRKNKFYEMRRTESEGNGYLASCQSKDGIIHMVSNRVEYAFNLKWLWPDYQP